MLNQNQSTDAPHQPNYHHQPSKKKGKKGKHKSAGAKPIGNQEGTTMAVEGMNYAEATQHLEGVVQSARCHLKGGDTDSETATEAVYNSDTLKALKTLEIINPALIEQFKQSVRAASIGLRPLNKAIKQVGSYTLKPSDEEQARQDKRDQEARYRKSNDAAMANNMRKNGRAYIQASKFVHQDHRGSIKIVAESIIAQELTEAVSGFFAYQPESRAWYRYTRTHWQSLFNDELSHDITRLLESGCEPIGYSSRVLSGVLSLVEQSGTLKLPDANREVIPFKNGLLDIGTGKLTKATPETAQTHCLPHDHADGIDCPEFKKWLFSAINNDKDTLKFLQAWIAAVITGRADLQVFLHLVGFGGSGKGTFFRLLSAIVDACNVFTTSFKALNDNRFELAGVVGKRLILIPDADGYGGSMEALKTITGQDSLRIERKGQQQGSGYVYEGMVMIASNTYTTSTDNSSGIERRRKTIRFDRVATSTEKEAMSKRGGIDAVLQAEIPQIINWALQLNRESVTNIIETDTEAMKEANQEAARHNNPVRAWIDDSCDFSDVNAWTQTGVKNGVATKHLYPNFISWCSDNGIREMGCFKFTQTLEDACQSTDRKIIKRRQGGSGLHGYLGVSLNDEAQDRNIAPGRGY